MIVNFKVKPENLEIKACSVYNCQCVVSSCVNEVLKDEFVCYTCKSFAYIIKKINEKITWNVPIHTLSLQEFELSEEVRYIVDAYDANIHDGLVGRTFDLDINEEFLK